MVRTVFRGEGIQFSYTKQHPILNGLSLHIEDQSIVGIVGTSGSGKTTLAKVMLGLEEASAGHMVWFNELRNESTNRRVGYVPQDLALLYDLSVYENVLTFGKLYQYRGERLRRLVSEALQLVGLWELRKKQLQHLTTGQLQRLNIACGIVHAPNVVIFDEVTAMVPQIEKGFIHEIMKQLHDLGITIIFLTREHSELKSLCTHIVELKGGKCKLVEMNSINKAARPILFRQQSL